jgi:oxepin-CoA hydrolase/3-oxo-5,6-dehydrosuberyl-CoA semialdehyde dehydrogenase
VTEVLNSYIAGKWHTPVDAGMALVDASTGADIVRISRQPLDYASVLDHARQVGGPALRDLTFVQRAGILKALGKHLSDHIPAFTELSLRTGATRRDSAVDIDGGIGVLFVYASKGTRELPDERVLNDGPFEPVGKNGTFGVQHICTPLRGASVQINAFNFPVWGMLEKFAPSFLAGVPTVVKPASQTAYLTEAMVREIVASGLLPDGAIQLVCARPTGLIENLTGQDLLSVTGSRETAASLRRHETVASNAVRFTAEADSLNSSILGPDATAGTAEFDLFVKGVVTEMTQKAGQKCTAIRRAFVPRQLMADVEAAIVAKLAKVTVGNPADETVRMGPLVSTAQREDVRSAVARLQKAANVVFGDPHLEPTSVAAGTDWAAGAFVSPILLRADDPTAAELHEVEAFGPVSTLFPYDSIDDALTLVARGEGSLVASVVTADSAVAKHAVLELASWHGRLLVLNAGNSAESTGHGAAIPHAVHGGPGRAGGGEELGGIRSVAHYLQRTAVQGSPELLAGLSAR